MSLQRQNQIREDILESWASHGLDVVIGPGFPFLAPQHHLPSQLVAASAVTGVYNALDFPVGTLPVIRKTGQDQVRLHPDFEDCKIKSDLKANMFNSRRFHGSVFVLE